MDAITRNEENEYLKQTLLFLKKELDRNSELFVLKGVDIVAFNREMWANGTHHTLNMDGGLDLGLYMDLRQYIDEYVRKLHSADVADKEVKKLERMLTSPYFGRVDFCEKGYTDREKIYIGYYNLMDIDNSLVYVYDWRAPISSIYYRFEPGSCSFDSPNGKIEGELLLKRQLKIEDTQLQYFFDSSLVIRDEILMKALSENANQKMKTIVSTIQKEQDLVIRDLTNGTIIVQGAAGSGKTSIALHRIAYLLYETKTTGLTRDNIIVWSPNDVFGDYIDEVLPELGEESVRQATFDSLFKEHFKDIQIESKYQFFEKMISLPPEERSCKRIAINFKGSKAFVTILDRYIKLYEKKLHKFKDIYYEGRILFTKEELKEFFLDNQAHIPAQNRLNRLLLRIEDVLNPLFEITRQKIKKIVYNNPKLRFEEQSHIKNALAKRKAFILDSIKKEYEIHYKQLYASLMRDRQLFLNLAHGLELPKELDDILDSWSGFDPMLTYEDASALLYLKLKLCTDRVYADIRHVVIDEAQDYYTLHYELINLIFPNARYTILGDRNQTIEKSTDESSRADLHRILGKGAAHEIELSKSYRSSYEINAFCNKVLGDDNSSAFERSGGKPVIIKCTDDAEMLEQMKKDIESYQAQGLKSIAIITKKMDQAEKVYTKLDCQNKNLLTAENEQLRAGINIMPCYMAKGLEFDAVLAYSVDDSHYCCEFDRKLLYIVCTRALHRLSLYFTGQASPYLPEDVEYCQSSSLLDNLEKKVITGNDYSLFLD